jgi:tetratricopeptide (TPR) repeat protein
MKTRDAKQWIWVTTLVLALCGRIASAQDHYHDIDQALRSHRYREALDLAHAALAGSPDDPRLWTFEGVAYANIGNKKEALSCFRNALRLAPDDIAALQQEAQLEYETGSMAAVPVLEHILRLQPGDPTAHAMIAVVEYKNGHCAAAIPHFAKSGTLLDTEVDGLHAYATCLVRGKQLEDAAKVFERALVLRANDPQERRVLASVQLMAHDPQGALTTLAPLIDTASPDAPTLELAASAYEDAHETARAVSTLRQAILLSPQDVTPYIEFAQISLDHSSYQVGVDVLNDGIAEQPNASQLYFARGVLYVNLAQFEKAEADFQKAYELDPHQSLTAAAQGLLAVQQNDLDRALSDTRAKLTAKPNDPVLRYLEADILTQKGVKPGNPDFDRALHSAQRAVALRPNLAPAHAVLAKLYLDAGKHEQAAQESQKALAIDPKDQTSLYRLIQARRKAGYSKELPELLKRLAELRKQAAQEEGQRNRYKLVEGENQ